MGASAPFLLKVITKVWDKNKLNQLEYKAWKVYEAYQYHNRKRGMFQNFLPQNSDPRKSKYWNYFMQVVDNFKNDTTFDPYLFIESLYRNNDSLLPAQLKTKKAVEVYNEHREAKKVMEDVIPVDEKIADNLISTFKLFKKIWKENGRKSRDYDFLFKEKNDSIISIGINYCIQGMVSKFFLCVSKTFLSAYKELDRDIKFDIITDEEIIDYRVKLKSKIDIYEFAKNLFKGEII